MSSANPSRNAKARVAYFMAHEPKRGAREGCRREIGRPRACRLIIPAKELIAPPFWASALPRAARGPPAGDLAPILEDIRRRRHHEPQPAELARDIPGIAGLVSGSGAPTDRSGRGRTQLREAGHRYDWISGDTGEPLAWVRRPGVLQQPVGRRCCADRDCDHDRVGRPIARGEMASFPQPLHRVILLYRGRALDRVLP